MGQKDIFMSPASPLFVGASSGLGVEGAIVDEPQNREERKNGERSLQSCNSTVRISLLRTKCILEPPMPKSGWAYIEPDAYLVAKPSEGRAHESAAVRP